MTSRERALTSLRHEQPDRVPVDYWATRETDAKLFNALGVSDRNAVLDRLGVDFVYIEGPTYIGPALATHADGTTEDIWGVPRRTMTVGVGDKAQSYTHVTAPPLADATNVDELLSYPKWPDPDWLDFSVVAEQCAAAGDRCVMFMGDRRNRIAQFKPAQYLRGMEEVMIDMIEAPEMVAALVGRIAAFYVEYTRRILDAADGRIDVLVTGDDFGMQQGMLTSPAQWRQFLLPGFRRFIEIAHEYDVPVMHHTCGSVREIVPDMIDAGLDVLNPIQPGVRNMDHAELKATFGDRLCFHGGMSIQTNLPHGRPADVREEVRTLMATMKPGGGFWANTAHNIQADVPVENVLALFEAYQEFGQY